MLFLVFLLGLALIIPAPKDCPCEDAPEEPETNVRVASENDKKFFAPDMWKLIQAVPYNSTYPLTKPIANATDIQYQFALITDLDTSSKSDHEKHTWYSYLIQGTLTLRRDLSTVHVEFDHSKPPGMLKSTLSQGGRAMELSDLKVFNGELLSVDDRTGVVYKIDIDTLSVIPWVFLPDGPGNVNKGFKAEWMTVKGKILWVGGLGKEWTTTTGKLVNFNPMWVKLISHTGYVRNVDWRQVYVDLRAKADIYYPGYMIHESGQWSDIHNRWFFLPRRASNDTYTEAADETRGTNIMLMADETFSHIEVRRIGTLNVHRGFSAFQFIPNTHDTLIVALKTEEVEGRILSYITVFNINGRVILEEHQLEGEYKYEGIEFV